MKHIFFSIFIVFASININADDVNKISSAYSTQTSDLQVSSRGTVVKLLSDDNTGSRHQRFILKLSNNQTVLVAHNIDLAPKITALRRGDTVEFNGEYEWNSKGGVIHWTHHDPAGRHQDGWLKHNGAIYE
jgi:molybdopterin converting factor small subunit